jgi:hypothetical protein
VSCGITSRVIFEADKTRLDYLINVFGLSTKEAQKALKGT